MHEAVREIRLRKARRSRALCSRSTIRCVCNSVGAVSPTAKSEFPPIRIHLQNRVGRQDTVSTLGLAISSLATPRSPESIIRSLQRTPRCPLSSKKSWRVSNPEQEVTATPKDETTTPTCFVRRPTLVRPKLSSAMGSRQATPRVLQVKQGAEKPSTEY